MSIWTKSMQTDFYPESCYQVLGWESEFLESILLLPLISHSTPLAGEWVFTMKNKVSLSTTYQLGVQRQLHLFGTWLIQNAGSVGSWEAAERVWYEPMMECAWRKWLKTQRAFSHPFTNTSWVSAGARVRAGACLPAYAEKGKRGYGNI